MSKSCSPVRAGPPPTDLVLAGIRPRWSFPAVIDHARVLRVSLSSDSAVSRPLFSLSPSLTSLSPPVSAGRRGHRVPGLGTGLCQPAGRPVPMEARPITRPGPAVWPAPSGHCPAWPRFGPVLRPACSATVPACTPAWTDQWAGPNSNSCIFWQIN